MTITMTITINSKTKRIMIEKMTNSATKNVAAKIETLSIFLIIKEKP